MLGGYFFISLNSIEFIGDSLSFIAARFGFRLSSFVEPINYKQVTKRAATAAKR